MKNQNLSGEAINGQDVGSGHDVYVERESDTLALVWVDKVGSSERWLAEYAVGPDDDMQRLAVAIGGCPSAALDECVEEHSAEWEEMVRRWRAAAATNKAANTEEEP